MGIKSLFKNGNGKWQNHAGCDGPHRSVAERSYSTPKVGAAAERSNPSSKERWLRGCRRADRSYSTFKVRRGDLDQSKEQRLHFVGTA